MITKLKLLGLEAWIMTAVLVIAVLVATQATAISTSYSRVSVSSSNSQANGGSSSLTASADGRYVTFYSSASNLVTGDNNGKEDIFLKDTLNGTVTRINMRDNGTESNGSVYESYISSNGRYVVYSSTDSSIVSSPYHTGIEVFLYDRTNATTTLVSKVGSSESNNHSYARGISSDGRFVLIKSAASNLVSGDTNGQFDLFLKDMTTGTYRVVNPNSSGNPSGYVGQVDMNCDGSMIAFASYSTTVVGSNATSSVWSQSDIFLTDFRNGSTTTNLTSSGNGYSDFPQISCDGTATVYESTSTNVAPSDTNNQSDVFLYDLSDNITKLVSSTASGTIGSAVSIRPYVSDHGKFVAFMSTSTNLDTSGGYMPAGQVFLKNMDSGAVNLISREQDGTAPTYQSEPTNISFDGKTVFFQTTDSNIVSGDTNSANDIFKTSIN